MDNFLALSDQDKQDQRVLKEKLDGLFRSLQPGQPDPTSEQRRSLLSSLLSLLSTSLAPSSAPTLLNPALGSIKILGRSPAGSEELGREKGLSALVEYGGLQRIYAATPLAPLDIDGQKVAGLEKDPLTSSESEALRCLCNVLMLHPSSRDVFPNVLENNKEALGGLVRLLDVEGAGFLAGRLLFLLTSKQSDLVVDLAEKGDVVHSLESFANRYIALLQSPGGPPTPTTDILREHLKFAYNLMLQYGRQPASSIPPVPAIPESVLPPQGLGLSPLVNQSEAPHDDTEDNDSLSDSSNGRPESPAPAAGGSGKKKHFWSSPSSSPNPNSTSPNPSEGGSTKRSKSPRLLAQRIKSAVTKSPKPDQATSSPTPPLHSEATEAGELSMTGAERFLPLFQPLLKLSVLLPIGDPKDPSPLLRGAMNALLNFPIQLEELDGFDHSWLQEVPGHNLEYLMLPHLPSKAYELLEIYCDKMFPTDVLPSDYKKKGKEVPAHPDDLIPKGLGESTKIEEVLGPLMLLLRKLSLLQEPGMIWRQMLLPDDIDRSVGLERRPDLIGHLIRLMSSILLPNTAYGVGEFIFNLCDRDPTILSNQIGYGNASGFLQSRGELIPPPAAKSPNPTSSSGNGKKGKGVGTPSPLMGGKEWGSGEKRSSSPFRSKSSTGSATATATSDASTSSRPINPITGAYEKPIDPNERQMTDAEKEREAEKLYVLFDRMAKTGVMTAENPVKKAAGEGRFEETSEAREAELKRLKEEEEEEEREVERELREYKERKARRPEAA